MHDYDSARGWSEVDDFVREGPRRRFHFDQQFSWVGIFVDSSHAWNSSQARRTVYVFDAKVACSGSQPTASGAGQTTAARMCQMVFAIDGRGQTAAGVGNTPCWSDASSLRGASSTSSARCYDFLAAWHACGCPLEMQSGCDGASRMGLCRGGRDGRDGDGGGAGVSARPCRRWVPFDNGRLWNPPYCDGALRPYSSSSRANALLRALPTSEYRPLVAAWGCLLQRVPQVTPVEGR